MAKTELKKKRKTKKMARLQKRKKLEKQKQKRKKKILCERELNAKEKDIGTYMAI